MLHENSLKFNLSVFNSLYSLLIMFILHSHVLMSQDKVGVLCVFTGMSLPYACACN